MDNLVFSKGEWICSKEFENENPVNLFFKENNRQEVVLPEDYKNLHMLTRKKFTINEKTDNYRIKITADEYCRL